MYSFNLLMSSFAIAQAMDNILIPPVYLSGALMNADFNTMSDSQLAEWVNGKPKNKNGMDLNKENVLTMSGKRFSKFAFGIIDLFLFLLFSCSKTKFLF